MEPARREGRNTAHLVLWLISRSCKPCKRAAGCFAGSRHVTAFTFLRPRVPVPNASSRITRYL